MGHGKTFLTRRHSPRRSALPLVAIKSEVVEETLPWRWVQYPNHYGAFFAFSEHQYGPFSLCECARAAVLNAIRFADRQDGSNADPLREAPLSSGYFPDSFAARSLSDASDPMSWWCEVSVQYGPHLAAHHQQLLEASAISVEVATARGYRTLNKKSEVRDVGFGAYQCLVPALLSPVYDVHGKIATYQLRPDNPRLRDGKLLKYETPAKSRMVLDVPPAARGRLDDPSVPLFITEGARKADSAVSIGIACVALLGVSNFRGTNDYGGKTALADWEWVALNGRAVYIVFDSDVVTKPPVHMAMVRLSELLKRRAKLFYRK